MSDQPFRLETEDVLHWLDQVAGLVGDFVPAEPAIVCSEKTWALIKSHFPAEALTPDLPELGSPAKLEGIRIHIERTQDECLVTALELKAKGCEVLVLEEPPG